MDDQDGTPEPGRQSMLPYDQWAEDALKHVVARALLYAGANGLPGEHHFYVTFRTDHADTVVPTRLKAQYPEEMTIVLQHQFWELRVNEAASSFSVVLSFGGVPSTLVVPFAAITAFADPHAQFALRFRSPDDAETPAEDEPEPAPAPAEDAAETPATDETPQVVSLDAFRRRSTPKE